MTQAIWRPSRVEVDLAVLKRNAQLLAQTVAPAALCAVVKADGYGHGAVPAAKAALAGGATWLAVALVEEGVTLREAGIDAPILVLSEPPANAMHAVVRAHLVPAIYTLPGVSALTSATQELKSHDYPVHLKVDTGMHRAGAQPDDVRTLVKRINLGGLYLQGIFTHLAVSDEPTNPFTNQQAQQFDALLNGLQADGLLPPIVHISNSGGGLTRPDLRRSLVRCGISLYGLRPSAEVPLPDGVKPAMSVKSEVTLVKRLAAGERLSYGLRYELTKDSNLATVPIGYADGVPRTLSAFGGDVIINGTRYPIAGTVTMDQLVVDCGDDEVRAGDEVVVFGSQGHEEILAEEVAQRTGTIGYEVICRMGPRLPRIYVGGPELSA